MTLRFVIRNGQKILQYGYMMAVYDTGKEKISDNGLFVSPIVEHKMVWQDIPVCDEETGEEIDNSLLNDIK